MSSSALLVNLFYNLQVISIKNPYFCVAFSGGLDSSVLLHALSLLKKQGKVSNLSALHVHHGLNKKADLWAANCINYAKKINIECRVLHIKQTFHNNIEAQAREARYQLLVNEMQPNTVLLTAHHLADSAETFLLQAVRGAGPKGLSAMARQKPLGQGVLLRPLLDITSEALKAYAHEHTLTWVEDDSNLDCRFDRNYLRHKILPGLKAVRLGAEFGLARAAKQCQAIEKGTQQLLALMWHSFIGSKPNTLSVNKLKSLPHEARALTIRYWFTNQGIKMPNERHLSAITSMLLTAGIDKHPSVTLGSIKIQRYQDDLYALPASHQLIDESLTLAWDLASPLKLPAQLGTLVATPGAGLDRSKVAGELQVRLRRGGERIALRASQGSRSVKKIMQEAKIPPWQRNRLPMLYSGDTLVAIVGIGVASDYACQQGIKILLEE